MSTRSTKNVCSEEPLSPKLTEQLYYPKRESIRGFFSLDSPGTEGEGEGISPVLVKLLVLINASQVCPLSKLVC